MTILFLMGDHLEARRGLWQRLGFAIMYGWLPGLLFSRQVIGEAREARDQA